MALILVDTSAWVEFDRSTGSRVHLRMRELISPEGPLAVSPPIIMEVLIGARTDRREGELRRMLSSVRQIPFDAASDFDAAVRIYRRCRKAGVTPRGIVDCMVASIAQRSGCHLLSFDTDLARVAEVVGITLDDASLTVG